MIGAGIIGLVLGRHLEWWSTEFLLGLLAVVLLIQ